MCIKYHAFTVLYLDNHSLASLSHAFRVSGGVQCGEYMHFVPSIFIEAYAHNAQTTLHNVHVLRQHQWKQWK